MNDLRAGFEFLVCGSAAVATAVGIQILSYRLEKYLSNFAMSVMGATSVLGALIVYLVGLFIIRKKMKRPTE